MISSAQVAAEDRRLESTAQRANGDLARHRWHWTLNKANPGRMTIAAYARLVRRDPITISRHAGGYASWLEQARSQSQGTAPALPLRIADHIETAAASDIQREALQAVAGARGISVGTARQHHGDEVRSVRDSIERELLARPGETGAEQRQATAENAARSLAAAQQLATRNRDQLAASRLALALLIESELGKARHGVLGALDYARQIDPEDAGFLARLQRAAGEIDAITGLVRDAVAGGVPVDWDAELTRLVRDVA
jgi:hypothetical protein